MACTFRESDDSHSRLKFILNDMNESLRESVRMQQESARFVTTRVDVFSHSLDECIRLLRATVAEMSPTVGSLLEGTLERSLMPVKSQLTDLAWSLQAMECSNTLKREDTGRTNYSTNTGNREFTFGEFSAGKQVVAEVNFRTKIEAESLSKGATAAPSRSASTQAQQSDVAVAPEHIELSYADELSVSCLPTQQPNLSIIQREPCEEPGIMHNGQILTSQVQLREEFSKIQEVLTNSLQDKISEIQFSLALGRVPRTEQYQYHDQVLTDLSTKADDPNPGVLPRSDMTSLAVLEPQPEALVSDKPQSMTVSDKPQSLNRHKSFLDSLSEKSGLKGLAQTCKLKMDDEIHDIDTSKIKLRGHESSIGSIFRRGNSIDRKLLYYVEDLYKTKGCCQAIARSSRFSSLTCLVVLLNAIYLAVESEKQTKDIYSAEWPFQLASQCFAIYFVVELLIRFNAFAKPFESLKDGWFCFDFVLLIFLIVDLWIMMPVIYYMSTENKPTGVNFITQPLRLMRLLKVSRMASFMHAFPELITLMKALLQSFRAIMSTLILLSGMMYMWSILLHTLLRDEKDLNDRLKREFDFSFSSIGSCLWTLLMDGVLQLDNAALVMTTLVHGDTFFTVFAGIAFTVFSLLSSLLILQMLIGVLCDVVARIRHGERDAEAIALVKQELLVNLLRSDKDGEGRISHDELTDMLDSDRSKAVLKKLKVNRAFFVQMAKMLYPDASVSVPVETIMDLLIFCRGEAPATVNVLASCVSFLSNEFVEMENRLMHRLVQNHLTLAEQNGKMLLSRDYNGSLLIGHNGALPAGLNGDFLGIKYAAQDEFATTTTC